MRIKGIENMPEEERRCQLDRWRNSGQYIAVHLDEDTALALQYLGASLVSSPLPYDRIRELFKLLTESAVKAVKDPKSPEAELISALLHRHLYAL